MKNLPLMLSRSLGQTNMAALLYVLSKFGFKGVSFLMIPVWTTVFAPAEYGLIGNIMAWTGFAAPFILFGLPSAVIRKKSEFEDIDEWNQFVMTVALSVLFLSVMFISLGLFLGPVIWEELNQNAENYWPLIPVAIASVATPALGRLGQAVSQAEQRPKMAIFYEQLLSLGMILSAVVLVVVYDLGVVGYIIASMLIGLVASIFFFTSILRRQKKFQFRAAWLKSALIFGLPLLPQAIAVWAMNLSDRLIVEAYHGLDAVGFYTLAGNFSLIISMVAVCMNQAVLPRYFSVKSRGENHPNEIRNLSFPSFWVLAILVVGIIGFGPMLLDIVLNERYQKSLEFIPPICLGCGFFGFGQFFLRPLLQKKKTTLIAVITIAGAVLNIGLNFWLVPKYGALGASWTTAGSYFTIMLVSWLVSRRSDRMEMRLREVILFLILSSFPIVLGILAKKYSETHYFWQAFGNVLLLAIFAAWGFKEYQTCKKRSAPAT